MAKFIVRSHVETPIERVFKAYSEFETAPQRVSAITRVEMLTDGPVGLGTRFRETRMMFNREATEEMEVVKFEPNRAIAVGADSCGTRYHSEFRFKTNGSGTDIEFEMVAIPQTLFAKLMSPIMGLMMGKMVQKCVKQDFDDVNEYLQKNA